MRHLRPSGPASERLVGLDILRSLAIILVLIAHFSFIERVKDRLIWNAPGIWGVELFFALSGFLITGLLYRVFSDFTFDKLKIYFIRRWMRTIPLYYFAIVVTLFLEGVLLGAPIVQLDRYFLFLQTIPIGANNWFGVSWSLCVEEWSYILIPCLAAALWFVRSLNGRFALIFSVAIVLLSTYRLVLGHHGLPFDADIRRALIPRLDALAYGGLLRVFWTCCGPSLKAARFWLLAGSVAGQGLCFEIFITYGMRNSFAASTLLTLLPVSLCLGFPAAIALGGIAKCLRQAFLYFATRSYALYLFHLPIYMLTGRYLSAAPLLLKVAIAYGLAFMIADTAYRRIEKPFIDLRPAEPESAKPTSAEATA